MLFLIKYLVRHLLLLLLIAILAEIAVALYSDYQLTPTTFWATFFTYLSNELNTIIQKFVSLQLRGLLVVEWLLWLFETKPYYIVLLLLAFVVYFNLQQKSLEEPKIVRQPKVALDRYQRQKKENTQRQLQKLKESDEYIKFKRGKYFSRLPNKDDDEVVAELREKQAQFF